ncbi:protein STRICTOSIDINE SYNTHASE-LIKE 4-like [Vicia villosa]|uniref:protein STRICTOSIDINE SYNTHASE-LIKE 4-like n=1 Tax=Vicia villosa TaxID=3911 RepID=UPI00273BA04B|nr:protein STRICTOSIDINE SYNTHASE-LIKE 4-like [Vicia villosa]
MASNLIKTLTFVMATLVAFTLQLCYLSPIDPVVLHIPPAASSFSSAKNNQLQNVIKLGEGIMKRPEDVCVDKGVLYTATEDGWIKRMVRNGNWENWKHIDSSTLLGITTLKDGGLIVCDATMGLLKVTEEDGFSVILSQVNGSQLLFTDDVIEASDGNIYFSIPSTKFGMHNWFLDVLEARPHGQVLKYNPISNETTIVFDDLAFPNGVALSKDEDYLLVCETWKFRCIRHWLKGNNKGKTDIYIENLPGGPDNINLAPDGSFWIALLQMTSERTSFMHTSKVFKHLLASFPRLINLFNSAIKSAMVVKVDTEGNIIKRFGDNDGKIITGVTSVVEFEDHLYLGNINTDFVGKFQLPSA